MRGKRSNIIIGGEQVAVSFSRARIIWSVLRTVTLQSSSTWPRVNVRRINEVNSRREDVMSEAPKAAATPVGPHTKKRGHQHHPRNRGNRTAMTRAAFVPQQHRPLSNQVTDVNNLTSKQQQQIGIEVATGTGSKFGVNSAAKVPAITKLTHLIKRREINDDGVANLKHYKDTLNKRQQQRNSETKPSDRSITINCSVTNASTSYAEDVTTDMSLVFRPAAEGSSQSDQDEADDPETAALALLRCTSERTELVAERENRRRKRRCADYPGLAFGSSIFSSDTLMKFSVIRNELHNIMNTQLKRLFIPDVLHILQSRPTHCFPATLPTFYN